MNAGDENESLDDAKAFADAVVSAAEGSRRITRRRVAVIAAILLLVATSSCIWWLTPLRHWIDIEQLAQLARRFSESPFGPFVMLAMFVVGGLLLVPVNLLTAVSVLVFGPVAGSTYALAGAVLSATVLYEISLRIPLRNARQRFGPRLQTIHAHLLRHGIIAVAQPLKRAISNKMTPAAMNLPLRSPPGTAGGR